MRIIEFDIVKGFAISVVVFVHATFFNFDKLAPLSQKVVMGFSTFLAPAIAIFFFISGFPGYKSYVKANSFKIFEKRKLSVILPPYLFWSTVYLFLQAEMGYIIRQPYHLTMASLIKKYTLGETFLPFYYVIVLMIFYLLTPFISKLPQRKMKRLLIVLFAGGLFVISLYFVPFYFGKEYISSLMTYRDPFTWMFFYV
jgi:surface polysaccharide O-acyltransferase-like enzyme